MLPTVAPRCWTDCEEVNDGVVELEYSDILLAPHDRHAGHRSFVDWKPTAEYDVRLAE